MDFSYTSSNEFEQFAQNVNQKARENKIDPIIGRDDEIRRTIEILSRKTKNNPILIGEPGVGKTAIVEGLAQRIVSGDVPDQLKNVEIYELSLSSLVAGSGIVGTFEKRLHGIIKKVQESDGRIILFIDEIHQLIDAGKVGGQDTMNAANILKPAMARGDIKIIGATTIDEYREHIEKDRALERRMQKVLVKEPTVDEAITILRGLKERWEIFHKVKIYDAALVAACKLSNRYITDKYLPDKAIDLIDEASSKVKMSMSTLPPELEKINRLIIQKETERFSLDNDDNAESKKKAKQVEEELDELKSQQKIALTKWNEIKSKYDNLNRLKSEIEIYRYKAEKLQADGKFEQAAKMLYVEIPKKEKEAEALEEKLSKDNTNFSNSVNANEVGEVISRVTGIPIKKLLTEDKTKFINLAADIKQRIKGQDNAVNVVSKAILRSKAGINDPNRPIGTFLFVGPTGVGKTELAKVLSSCLFDNEKALIRIDMSEYVDKHEVSKLIGAAPGYVGYGDNGGGGILTNAVRTNPYSVVLFDEIEKAHPDVLNILLQILDDGILHDSKGRLINFKNTVIIMTSNIGSQEILDGRPSEGVSNLKKYLRPEFLNRIDEIVVFNPIHDPVILSSIVGKLLNDLQVKLENQEIHVDMSDEKVNKKVCKESFDPTYGARPIRRYIQNKIENFLAQNILDDKLKKNKSYKMVLDKSDNFDIQENKKD